MQGHDHVLLGLRLIDKARALVHATTVFLGQLLLAGADQGQAVTQVFNGVIGQGVFHTRLGRGIFNHTGQGHLDRAQDVFFFAQFVITHANSEGRNEVRPVRQLAYSVPQGRKTY